MFRRLAARDQPPQRDSRRGSPGSHSLPVLSARSGRMPRESLDAPENLPKRLQVKWLSASWRMKYRACRMRRPPVLNGFPLAPLPQATIAPPEGEVKRAGRTMTLGGAQKGGDPSGRVAAPEGALTKIPGR